MLLADETTDAIEKYLYAGKTYIVLKNDLSIGVFVVVEYDKDALEIKNIAVEERHQGLGLGSFMLSHIKQFAKQANYTRILVGTPTVSELQIQFYKKNGFIPYEIRKNFYTENYSAPIIENNVQLTDMLVLQYIL